ncbi:MAG TPA: hypothetical protein VF414_00795 [Thermoanaerobaculia bacterium]
MRTARFALPWVLILLAVPAQALPDFFVKPPAWTSKLVTHDDKTVSDVQFAQLVAQTQQKIANKPHNTFTFLASFTQCFGGGFITELGRQGVTRYGGNSASTYFEPASYDTANWRSYYPFAWTTLADYPAGTPAPTDEWITWKAYDALDPAKAAVAGIPKNPGAAFERAQYLSDRVGGVPQALGSAMHNYVIVWVGKPHPQKADYRDVDKLYRLLIGAKYNIPAANVQILWADKTDPDNTDNWAPTGKATWADLQTAFKNVETSILGKPAGDTYQVFFYAGDHGNADYAITINVDIAAQGLPLTDLSTRRGRGNDIYLAGSGTNFYLVTEQTVGRPLKGLSFGDDFQNPGALFASSYASPSAVIYFSADNGSRGVADTELNLHWNNGAELQGPHVYARSQGGNRQMFHGARNLGLVTGAMSDDLNDFVMRDLSQVINGQTGRPTRPVFFTNDQDSRIWVFDPALGLNGATYVYYDFTWDYANPPRMVDALAMRANLRRRRPGTQQLYFDKMNDHMLFSVGRGEVNAPWNAYKPCDVLRFGGGANEMVWASCNFLGLDPMHDNLDGLDVGAGQYGQPISFDQEYPWPEHEYPNMPKPEQEPQPNDPLPGEPYPYPYPQMP